MSYELVPADSDNSLFGRLEGRYLNCRKLECEAAGGKRMWRLCFNDPSLDTPKYRISAIFEEASRCAQLLNIFVPFTVLLDGEPEKVLLNKGSLLKRFNISKRRLEQAVREDDLMGIAAVKIIRANYAEAPAFAENLGRSFHFSRKDFFDLRVTTFVTSKGVFLKRRGLLGAGERPGLKEERISRETTWLFGLFESAIEKKLLKKMRMKCACSADGLTSYPLWKNCDTIALPGQKKP